MRSKDHFSFSFLIGRAVVTGTVELASIKGALKELITLRKETVRLSSGGSKIKGEMLN